MFKGINFFLLFGCLSFAQIGIHGDVYLASTATVAIHTPETHFLQGVVYSVSETPAELTFMENNHGIGAHSGSHVQASVKSIKTESFVFPVGDQGVYQPLRITSGNSDDLSVAFKMSPFIDLSSSLELQQISNRFYWKVAGTKEAAVTLSWNRFSDLSTLTEELGALVMVGYTGTQWEIIPAQLEPFGLETNEPTTLNQGAISSIDRVDFSRYEALSLGSVLLNTELVISEGITPNGDGINDTWFIENIERYPEVKIWVFNRWGSEVFQADGNYNNTWDATYKNNTQRLPSGPYYYRIDQDNNGTIDLDGWIYITY